MNSISSSELIEIQARLAMNRKARSPINRAVETASCQPYKPEDAVERESLLHGSILDDLRKRGWLAFHGSMAHKARRTAGEPDFIVLTAEIILYEGASQKIVLPPRIIMVECKSKTGKRSPAQLQVAAHARKLGHTVHLVRSFSEWKSLAEGKNAPGERPPTKTP